MQRRRTRLRKILVDDNTSKSFWINDALLINGGALADWVLGTAFEANMFEFATTPVFAA